MNDVSPIRMIVFDLGGVLVRIARTWKEGCAAASLPVREAVLAPELIERRKHLRKAYEEGRIACDEFFAGLADATGRLYSPAELRRIHDAWLFGEYPGASELIANLHDAGLATGVLSNTNHAHWTQLLRYPAIARVQHLHPSHHLGVSKPDPEIYGRFQQRTGFQPAGILFFDDLTENVQGAHAAGWRAHQIDHTGDPAAQMRIVLSTAGLLTPA